MKLWILAVALTLPLGASKSFAEPLKNVIVTCESGHLTLTQNGENTQLILRDVPGVLEYFSRSADIRDHVDSQGEFKVLLYPSDSRTREIQGDYSGPLSGDLYVSASETSSGGEKIRILRVGYRGMNVTELANWVFQGCDR